MKVVKKKSNHFNNASEQKKSHNNTLLTLISYVFHSCIYIKTILSAYHMFLYF